MKSPFKVSMDKTPKSNVLIPDTTVVKPYHYDDGLIDVESYAVVRNIAPCYVIESRYTSKALLEYGRDQRHGLKRLRGGSKPKYSLPEPEAYRPIAIIFDSWVDAYLTKKWRPRACGEIPYGLAKDREGLVVSTYPETRVVVVRNPVTVVRSTLDHPDRHSIKAVVQQEVLAQKQSLWADQRAALNDEHTRKGSVASQDSTRKSRFVSRA